MFREGARKEFDHDPDSAFAGIGGRTEQGEGIDTYDRYVYLHGTNHEENLGVPASSGCLQVSNEDAIELHDWIPVGSHLFVKL